jgi:hypothetical protein
VSAPLFGDQKIVHAEGAQTGRVGHVAVRPGGGPAHLGIAFLVEVLWSAS